MARKRKSKPLGWRGRVFMGLGIIMGVVFLPTSILLVVGMIPTFVAIMVDRTRDKLKPLTVGAMNLAGCTPFILEMWTEGQSIDNALTYISEPRTVVVIYFAAAMGYLIDWAMTGIVAALMMERGRGRIKDIEKRQADLIERWGPEVTGDIPLDEYGFAIGSMAADPSR